MPKNLTQEWLARNASRGGADMSKVESFVAVVLFSVFILSGSIVGRLYAIQPTVCAMSATNVCGKFSSHSCLTLPCENCNTAPSLCLQESCSKCGKTCSAGKGWQCPSSQIGRASCRERV